MPATTTAPPSPAGLAPLFAGVLRSEARKLATVRSTRWALIAVVTFNVVTAALLGALLPGHLSAHQKATIDSVRVSLGGLHLSQVAIGLLGVLAVTGEYGSGMIRATLTAVPQRRLLLTAKALVLTAAAVATGIAACLAAYLAFQAFLPAGDALRTTLAGPGVLRAVTGAGLYLTVLALLGFGLGTVLRSSAGAVAVLFGVLFVPALLTALLPSSWQGAVGPYLPMNAGDTIYTVRPEARMLGPWPGSAAMPPRWAPPAAAPATAPATGARPILVARSLPRCGGWNAPRPRGPSAWTGAGGPCGPGPAGSRSARRPPTRRACGRSRTSSPRACGTSAGART